MWGRRPGVIAVDLLLLALGIGGIFVSPVGTGDGVDCLTSAFPKEKGRVLLSVHQGPAVSIAQEKVKFAVISVPVIKLTVKLCWSS